MYSILHAYTDSVIASIVIGTIQLGATVDYAILMTNNYKGARMAGLEKKEAVQRAVASSAQSIVVSALSFFASTFGVGVYSNIDMISSLCILMARGADQYGSRYFCTAGDVYGI